VRKEGLKMSQLLRKGIAATAAAATTAVLFSTVASMADSDQASMLAARIKPTTLAAKSTTEARR
jgi:hypothetical protein